MNHPVWLILVSIGFAAVPLVVSVGTAYLKVHIVLSMIRSGLGAQQVPSTVVIAALSLCISLIVMQRPLHEVAGKLAHLESEQFHHMPSATTLQQIRSALEPLLEFIDQHTSPRERAVVQSISAESALQHRLLAFMLTELREGFTMGFVILVPFLVIDFIVANILVGLGMMMVSPTLLSLPLKLILFVMVDGWLQLTRGLILSYGVVS